MLASKAEELGITSISDLEEHQDLTLYGSPECRQRIDCLVGLEEYYGLDGLRENFTPVDIGLRYEVLDKGDADLSILFTTDAQLFTSSDYTLLEDDQGVLPGRQRHLRRQPGGRRRGRRRTSARRSRRSRRTSRSR